METIYEVLGKRVRQERQRAGLTIERLAESAGISPSFLAYIETKGRKPSLETIERLAESLRVPVSELFGSIPGPKKDRAYDAGQQFIHMVRDCSESETASILGVVKATVAAIKKKRGR
jgi:transcriptional regulator with XRE-family HTH domain